MITTTDSQESSPVGMLATIAEQEAQHACCRGATASGDAIANFKAESRIATLTF